MIGFLIGVVLAVLVDLVDRVIRVPWVPRVDRAALVLPCLAVYGDLS